MKKVVLGIAGVAVVVGGGALAAPHLINWDKYKPTIQTAVRNATGYDVAFGGKIDMAVLPFPHVVIENLAVRLPKNPASTAEQPDLLSLKKADVSVALMPLLSGQVKVNSVELVDPVITLQVGKDGQQMWMTDTLKPAASQPAATATPAAAKANTAPAHDIALDKLEIHNGTLRYSDARSGQAITVEKINTTLSAASLNGPFKGKGSMVWNGQTIESDVETQRMDQAAKTVPVEVSIRIPATESTASFDGVIGTEGGIDVQGETRLVTKNLSAAVTAFSGKASTLPPISSGIEGVVTAKGEKAEIKTLKVTYGDIQAVGAASAANLSAKDAPMLVTLALESTDSVKLENLLPGKSVKTVKASPAADKYVPKDSIAKAFLPKSVSLPMPIDVTASVKLAGVSYQGAQFNDIKLTVDKKGNQIAINEDIEQLPGGGAQSVRSSLVFASGAQTADKKGVVYADPTLSYALKANATAPQQLLGAFLPDATMRSMQPMVKDPLAVSVNGTVAPTKATASSGSVTLGKTSLTLGPSSYSLNPSGQDDAAVSVAGQDINIDQFMPPKAAAPAPQPAAQGAATRPAAEAVPTPASVGGGLQESLKKIDLPVNLTVKADLKNVTFGGATYAGLSVDGTVAGGLLQLRDVSVQDAQGNVMKASGSVKDIHSLSGVDLVLAGKTSDGLALLKSFKVDTAKLPKDFGPLDLNVAVNGATPDSLNFNAKANALESTEQASGTLLNVLSNKPSVDKLSLHVTSANFERLAQKFDPNYRAGVGIKKDLDVSAAVSQDKDGYTLSGLNATIGSLSLTGDVKAVTTGAKPDITATLAAGTIPLDVLSGKDKTAKTAVASDARGIQTVTSSGGTGGGHWSREPLDLGWMQAFNLNLKVNAKSVEYGNWVLSNTILGLTIKDGVLDIGQMDAGVYGGTMSLTANVKAPGKGEPVNFAVKSAFKDVALEPLASSFAGARVIKASGNVSLTLDAQSSGVSPSALIAGLGGSGQMDGKNVVFQGFDLAAMSRALVSTSKVMDNISGLANATMAGGQTQFDKIDGPFTIAQGIVSYDKFDMTGPAATVVNKGQISLPAWTINMTSTVQLTDPKDAPPLDIKFQGSLDNPGNTFAGNAMQSYISSRVSNKLQKIIGGKTGGNTAINGLVNGLLGGNAAPAAVTTPATTAAPATVAPAAGAAATTPAASAPAAGSTTAAPAADAATTAAPATSTAPATTTAKPTRAEKVQNVLKLLGQ